MGRGGKGIGADSVEVGSCPLLATAKHPAEAGRRVAARKFWRSPERGAATRPPLPPHTHRRGSHHTLIHYIITHIVAPPPLPHVPPIPQR